ncbi:glycosyltransferase [Bacillus sp. JJ1562]|uniref:glycosyltransferase n=1 Tax=Bacillus sp. JJ1562 TaxID=3122960 RepID=UPI0030038688
MTSKPSLSVIMSVYNNEEYLEEAVESILNQTFSDFEFIITDDCSVDNSLKIIESYAAIDDRIIIIKNQQNMGLTKSLNNMINLANAEYIARMDGDDIADLDRFKKQMSVINDKPEIDLIFGDTSLIDEKGSRICDSWRPKKLENILKNLEYHNFIPHPTVIFKKSAVQSLGGYNEEYKLGQDKELWVRFKNNGYKFYYINQFLLSYRINPKSVRRKVNVNRYYFLANTCINNKKKKKVFNYIRQVSFKEKLILFIKFLIPHKILFIKGIWIRKFRRN